MVAKIPRIHIWCWRAARALTRGRRARLLYGSGQILKVGFPLTRQMWIFQYRYEYVMCLIENTQNEFCD